MLDRCRRHAPWRRGETVRRRFSRRTALVVPCGPGPYPPGMWQDADATIPADYVGAPVRLWVGTVGGTAGGAVATMRWATTGAKGVVLR